MRPKPKYTLESYVLIDYSTLTVHCDYSTLTPHLTLMLYLVICTVTVNTVTVLLRTVTVNSNLAVTSF